jgi:Ca2+-binding EF-hand superfamily protein
MMKMILASVALFVFAAPALAQPSVTETEPSAAEDKFVKHDADSDGALSVEEVKTVDANATQSDFDKYDADKDDGLSKEEFAMWIEARTTPPASAPGR